MIPVSVVIPIHNNEKTLDRCIQSALKQGTVEIILVNNNSTDSSRNIAETYTSESNVSLHDCTPQGSAHARNMGLELSTSNYIQFLDADDYLLEDKLNKQLDLIGKADIVSSAYKVIEEGYEENKSIEEHIWKGLILGTLGVTSSMLFRKSALEKAGAWDPSISNNQEYDVLFRILQQGGQLVSSSEIGTVKDNRSISSISKTTVATYPIIAISLRQKIEKHLKEKNLITDELDSILHRFYYDKICWLFQHDQNNAQILYKEIFSDPEKRKAIPFGKRILENLFGFGNLRALKAKLSS